MTGYSRSASAHPGIRSPGCQARQSSNRDGCANRRVIGRTLRSRGGSSVAEPRREDIHLQTGPCRRESGPLIRDKARTLPPLRCPNSEPADLRVTGRSAESTVSLALIGGPTSQGGDARRPLIYCDI